MWSVFGHSVHTNNDDEGWSHCLNGKASHDAQAAESIPASKTSCRRSSLVDLNVMNVNLVKESEIVHGASAVPVNKIAECSPVSCVGQACCRKA